MQETTKANKKASKKPDNGERKQNPFCYYLVRALAWFLAVFVFRRVFVRNELKHKKGPCVVIANHEAALDFVNLIGASRRPMSFVISHSFYSTLPFKHIVKRLGMIPKQQFQTSIKDVRKMKNAIAEGKILVIYPAGLMSEDGQSTPIPLATYNFLKWMNTDVYVAKTSGTYFTMPKWSRGRGIRRCRNIWAWHFLLLFFTVYSNRQKRGLCSSPLSVL